MGLFIGNDESTAEFVKVTDDVKKVFCGNNNTLIIKKDKSLWAIGKDERGRFGLGTKKRSLYIPKQIANNIADVYSDFFYLFSIDTAGRLYLSGELNINSTYKNQFRFVEIDTNINQCGNNLYITKVNELYVIDYTDYYGLSSPTKIMDNIISAKAYNSICLALNKKKSIIWLWRFTS